MVLIQPLSLVAFSLPNVEEQVGLTSEGSGTNGLIQLFFELVRSENGSTVLIEEPETHLHPKAQAELAEVLADTAKAEDKQIIMSTHSEHLVERLLLLVAEGTLNSDDLAIYSFSKDEKGECSASEIRVTENDRSRAGLPISMPQPGYAGPSSQGPETIEMTQRFILDENIFICAQLETMPTTNPTRRASKCCR